MARPRVSVADLDMAAAWLLVNSGDGGEAEACHRVSEWLRLISQQRETDSAIRSAIKGTGVPLSKARARVREITAAKARAGAA